MAAAFLATHGIDLQAEIDRATLASLPPSIPTDSSFLPVPPPKSITLISSAIIHSSPSITHNENSTRPHDISLSHSTSLITSATPCLLSPNISTKHPTSSTALTASSCLCLPALTHPHIHLDKAHLYSHSRYDSLRPQSGTFQEALALTGEAKKLFEGEDLLQRANWLIAESVAAGVTAMRAFVEVDKMVGMRAVEMGVKIKEIWKERCHVQLCVFAQEAVLIPSTPENLDEPLWDAPAKELFERAAAYPAVEAVGSAPYIESSNLEAFRNVQWVIELAIAHRKHLDLHLDYTLDREKKPHILNVIKELRSQKWLERNPGRTVCLGHCTRLTLFEEWAWEMLKESIAELPIYFVGLPTSDIFMMGRPSSSAKACEPRPRGTLPVVWMVKELGLNAVLGVNNVGNAFTPWGSADPLSIASLGVGLYQVGTARDAEILYEAISTKAREAIGLPAAKSVMLKEGDPADLVIYGKPETERTRLYRPRRTIQEIVCDAGRERVVIKGGYRVDEGL